MNTLSARRGPLLSIAQAASAKAIATSPHPISEVRAYQIGAAESGNSYVVLQGTNQIRLNRVRRM